jgi:hypothetical protein
MLKKTLNFIKKLKFYKELSKLYNLKGPADKGKSFNGCV